MTQRVGRCFNFFRWPTGLSIKIDPFNCQLGGIAVEMSNLEQVLNSAIVAGGFRISPRMELKDRLSRFIQLYSATKGRHLTTAEADACSGILLLTHDSDSVQRSRRKAVSNQQSSVDFLDTISRIPSSHYKTHSMTLRSSA